VSASRQDRQDFSAEDWARFLSGQLGREVRVRFGHARRQVIVASPERAGLRVRMNQAFGRAPETVRIAVADWLRVGRDARTACRALDEWIASIVGTLGPPRLPRILERGVHHDLGEMLLGLFAHEFRALAPERRPSGVTWGRRGPRGLRRALRSLQLGSFDPETALIRIHPVLDQPAVPRWFVRYVLFHELLHAELHQACDAARRAQHHGREFRRREAAYADTSRALEWQTRNLSVLLRSARTGKPMPMTAARPRRRARLLQRLLFE
jgi:hypothetical protein